MSLLRKFILYDANGRELELTTNSNVPVETVENGHICTDNSTSTPLGISGVFNGDWQDTLNYNTITVGVKTDQGSAVDGLRILWSTDGISVCDDDVFTILANNGKVFTFSPARRYFKIIFTNGVFAQAFFSLQSIFKKGGFKASSHRINDSIIAEDDAELVKSVLSGEGPTGTFKNVPVSKDGALHVSVEDQYFRPISLRMNKVIQTGLTIASDTVIDSRTITMTAGHGLIAGDRIILLQENGEPQFFFTKIISVLVNVLTLDTLVPYVFSSALCEITQYDPDLNKDGSVTVYKAELRNPFSFTIDVTRFIIHMTDATAMDDATFGGRTALTYGISLRKNIPGSGNTHLWNCKTNGEIGELSFDKIYDLKAPAGSYGFSARITYAGQEKHGVAIKLDPGEAVELLIQDDLTLLQSFTIMVQGHFNE